jgi:hypothetical protein
MTTKKNGLGIITVNLDADTKIYSSKSLKVFSDLQVGMKVVVRGTWDKAMSKIQALIVKMNSLDKNTEDDD